MKHVKDTRLGCPASEASVSHNRPEERVNSESGLRETKSSGPEHRPGTSSVFRLPLEQIECVRDQVKNGFQRFHGPIGTSRQIQNQ